jgi:dephospho-CoA kinase
MIIALTGSFGAGKGAVVDYLIGKGFKHFSARAFITEEIEKRGLPTNRDSMIVVSNDLRAMHGPSHIIDSLHQRAGSADCNAVIESVRAVAEVRRLQELGATVIGVDADPQTRYERAVKRGSETDRVSFDEWLEHERKESNPDDPTKQDVFGALKASDYILQNNGSLEDLYAQVEAVLAKIKR